MDAFSTNVLPTRPSKMAATPPSPSPLTRFEIACMVDPNEALRLANDPTFDVNGRSPLGITPLMMAAIRGLTPVVAALLSRGADINAVDVDDGATALYLACRAAYPKTALQLIAAGADIGKDSGNFSPSVATVPTLNLSGIPSGINLPEMAVVKEVLNAEDPCAAAIAAIAAIAALEKA